MCNFFELLKHMEHYNKNQTKQLNKKYNCSGQPAFKSQRVGY